MSFAGLLALLRTRFDVVIAVTERDDWEVWFESRRSEAAALSARSSAAEDAIDRLVYRSFELTDQEIAAVEDALAVAAPSIDLKGYEAISAVEGLRLTEPARARLEAAGRGLARRLA